MLEIAQAELYQTPEEQRQADLICKQLRSDCIELFPEQNSKRRNLFFQFITLMRGGISLTRSIGGPEQPVKVIVVSNTLMPEKAEIITVQIEGLQEHLTLRENYGEIVTNIQVTGPRPNDVRRANLLDAERYKEVIRMIQEQNI